MLVGVALFAFYNKELTRNFYLKFGLLCAGFLLIFIIQYFNLGYLSAVNALGFLTKALIGAIVFFILKTRFAQIFYQVIFVLCLLSFPFFLLHILFGDDVLRNFFLGANTESVGLYTFRPQTVEESSLRNSGMFWEPGAFQAFINLCLFMNFYRMPYLLAHKKFSLCVIVLALITTQSTTGYIIFAMTIGAYILIYSNINKMLIAAMLALFVGACIYLFFTLDFLGEKVERQYEESVQLEGDFDPSRFGALLFDLHYIKKNPLTGNGFRPITRFADHPILIVQEENGEFLGHGNGFSDFIASAGILGMFWYFYTLGKFRGRGSLSDSLLLIMLMIVLLQGEHFLIYPFFLGLAFFKFNSVHEKKNGRINHLLQ